MSSRKPGYAYPFGMIAAEAGVDAIDFVEAVDEPHRGQRIRREPPAEIAERGCGGGGGRFCGVCRFLSVVEHFFYSSVDRGEDRGVIAGTSRRAPSRQRKEPASARRAANGKNLHIPHSRPS